MDARQGTPFPKTLRLVLLGGSAADPALIERAKCLSTPLVCTWGMTETASQAATSVPGQDPAGPLPPMPFSRVHANDGHLTVWGPIAIRNSFESQDIGEVDSAGRVLIHGRADRFITSGGAQIDLSEIEEVVLSNPDIAEAVALGIKDSKWGQRPVLAVVSSADTKEFNTEALLAWCREKLSGYKVPDEIAFLDEIPKNEMGKIQRSALRLLFQDTDSTKGGSELIGKADLLKALNRDEGVDKGGLGPQDAVLSTEDLVTEGDRVGANAIRGDHDAEPIPHAHGASEVGLGVDQRHTPSTTFEDTLEGFVPSSEHLLEDVMTVFEGAPKKGNAGTINVVKTDSDHVRKTHKDNSLDSTGKTP